MQLGVNNKVGAGVNNKVGAGVNWRSPESYNSLTVKEEKLLSINSENGNGEISLLEPERG
jgi:hypothetical protein